MRRNVRRLHREVNNGAATPTPAPNTGDTEGAEYTANGRTKRRKAASLSELKRFYEAAVDAASEVFSLAPATVGEALLAAPTLLPEPPLSTTTVARAATSLATVLSSSAERGGAAVIATNESADGNSGGSGDSGRNGEDCGGGGRGRGRGTGQHRGAARRYFVDSGEAFRATLRKKLEATGGTRCKLGSEKKIKPAAGAITDGNGYSSGGGGGGEPAVLGVFGGGDSGGATVRSGGGGEASAINDGRWMRFSSAVGSAEQAAGEVLSTIMSSSRRTTYSRYHERGRDESNIQMKRETFCRNSMSTIPRSKSFPKPVYPSLPGFKSVPPATPSQPLQLYSRSPLRWHPPSKLPVAAMDYPQVRDSPAVVAPGRTLGGKKSPPPPPSAATARATTDMMAPYSELGIPESGVKKISASACQERSTATATSKSVISCCVAPEQGGGATTTLEKRIKKRRLYDGPAPLMPYWRRRKETTGRDGRRVTFALTKKDVRVVKPPDAKAAAPPVVRFGIMQQRQCDRSSNRGGGTGVDGSKGVRTKTLGRVT